MAALPRDRASAKIARWWRRWALANHEDPITQEPLPASAFRLVEPNGTAYGFDAAELGRLFSATLVFQNPFTRRTLDSIELRRLTRAQEVDVSALAAGEATAERVWGDVVEELEADELFDAAVEGIEGGDPLLMLTMMRCERILRGLLEGASERHAEALARWLEPREARVEALRRRFARDSDRSEAIRQLARVLAGGRVKRTRAASDTGC
jgi:hypothetical protein